MKKLPVSSFQFPVSSFQFPLLTILIVCFSFHFVYTQNNSSCISGFTQTNINSNSSSTAMSACDFSGVVDNLPEANPEIEKYIIPVVVHLVHDNGDEELSTAEVVALIGNINEIFNQNVQNTNEGTNIEFCLAKVDPDGNCTDGITSTRDSILTIAPGPGLDLDPTPHPVQNLIRWDPSRYLNIWIIREFQDMSLLGFSSFPFVNLAGKEGIVVEYNAGIRTYVHEIGHFLGLFHTSGCGGSCFDLCGKIQSEADVFGDFLVDTNPVTNNGLSCFNECPGSFLDLPVEINNVMFSPFAIPDDLNLVGTELTEGQRNRMYYHLNTTNLRGLWEPGYFIRNEMIVDEPTKAHKDIEIFAGGRLVIKSEVIMAEGTGIIVHQGGQLVVDGGHIRGCDISDTERGLWNGITMRGRNQEGFDVELINRSTIEDVDGFAVKTQVNFDPITFQIRDNGRLNAQDTEFNNVGGLAQLAAIFARPNNSHIEGCTLNGGEVGISSTNCWDIDVIDNDFLEIEKECIKGSNGSFFIDDNDFQAGETDVALTYLLASVSSEIRNNRFFGGREGIRIVGATNAPNLINDNTFSGSVVSGVWGRDIYADGASHYSIGNNVFHGGIGVSSRANGGFPNEVIENEFIQTLVGIFPHDGNSDYTFFRNCFSAHWVDALILGKVANQIPNDGTHANNCFTHQGGLLNFPFYQNDIGGEPEPFDYFEPDDNNQDCRDAFLSHPSVNRILDLDDFGNTCDTFFSGGEDPESNTDGESDFENYLRNHDFAQLEIISQNQSGVEAKILSFSIELMQGNYAEARNRLDFSTESDQVGINDLSYVLNLYIDLLEIPSNANVLLQNNEEQLENIAQSSHPYSAYAQALYFMLTSEFVENLDLSIIEPFNNVGERSSVLPETNFNQKQFLFYPNPAQNVVNISNAQSITSLSIYNSLGELIYTTNKVNEILPIQHWKVGLYFFDVESHDNTRSVVKFIKSE